MTEPAPALDLRRVLDDDRRHVLHSWSASRPAAAPIVTRAEGCHIWDGEGRRYLDFSSQLVFTNLGHQHPALVEAIKRQADRLCTVAPAFANDARSQLARMIAERAPGDLEMVFFTNGGTEANEHALRMARIHTGRSKVLAAYRSYHGATGASIALTGEPRRWGSEPGFPSVVHFMGPYPYRSAFYSSSPEEECERSLAHLAQVIEFEGPTSIAAVILETIVGTNGVLVPPPGYLPGVRRLCDENGILLILDEVMVGFGRVGEWFACSAFGVVPDLITFAKGVNSGYVPLGGVLISDRVAETFAETPYPGGLTYGGHPLACAAGVASIETFERAGILAHVRRLGQEVVGPRLRALAADHPSVGEVRGMGLMWAVELVRDRESRRMLVPFNASGAANQPMAEVAAACRSGGLWPFVHFNRVQLAPPLIITEPELLEGIEILDRALDVADRYCGS